LFNAKITALSFIERKIQSDVKKMQHWDAQIRQLIKTYRTVKKNQTDPFLTKKLNFFIKKMAAFDPVDSINFLAVYPVHCIPELTQACQKHIIQNHLTERFHGFISMFYFAQSESVKKHYQEYFPQLANFDSTHRPL
jgi:hypothetical protein